MMKVQIIQIHAKVNKIMTTIVHLIKERKIEREVLLINGISQIMIIFREKQTQNFHQEMTIIMSEKIEIATIIQKITASNN